MHRRDTNIYRRGRQLKSGKSGAGPVVYWMSRDLRVTDNWGLLWAQQEAIIYERSLLVVFCITQELPDTTPNQIQFMAQGLQPIVNELQKLNIGSICLEKLPNKILPKLLAEIDAHSLICDFHPLSSQKIIKKQLAEQLFIPINEVDSHNIIPAWTTSSKKEYAAYTISVGEVHDRAWGERPVFGRTRYMNEAGCRRNFDVNSYTADVLSTVGSK